MVEEQALEFMRRHVPKSNFADVRQFHLPGSPIHGPLHAEAGGVVPLPQPRRVNAQGIVQTLEAGSGEGAQEAGQA
jgi:hypothetical protein